MGRLDRETGEIHAKIVYYGPSGSGKTANLQFIYRKLKKEHRGELRTAYAGKGKRGRYELLPVQLGAVRGFTTSIHVHTVPGANPYAEERRRILEGVDGVIFVADLRPEQHEGTVKSLEELETHVESYGRSFETIPLVLQYNHSDEADETALEKLHAKLGVKPEAYLEGIATDGTGVLQCLTTLSKAILARIRQEAEEAEAEAEVEPEVEAELEVEPVEAEVVEFDPSPNETTSFEGDPDVADGLHVEAAGPVTTEGRELRIPLRLVEEESGRKIELSLRVTIDG